ncbi:MAG: DMT family transporter [Lachnospiraceae bacterium]|nr:DMT family transporter [Lachnospiraceae bacterium]
MSDTGEKKSIFTIYPVVVASAMFCCILWGSATPAIKIAYELFGIGSDDVASRLMLAGARFMLAGIMTVIFGSLILRKPLYPKKSTIKYVLFLSLFQTIGQYYFFFMALAHTSGVRGSLINASGNFFAILFAIYIFRTEKPAIRKIIGCLVGFAGIVLIIGNGADILSGSVSLKGEGAMLAAAFFYAVSGCLISIFSKYENPVILSGYQFMAGGLVLYIIGSAMGGALVFGSPACIGNLIYMGFISAGAYTLWGVLLKYNPVSRVSILGFMNPVMGVVLSALFLGEIREAFSLKGLLALFLIVMGIIIVNSRENRKTDLTTPKKV